ncbi:RNA dependent RNA polymerase [Paenibacillus sp. Root444D2]|uniref:RNA dependent RNA polymerase n=1 Tax=Paenibacillus sp. Root444D2 TaxID=1736538 RepID=UPI00070F6E35|nr:hypothetical protein [Paenibacillus sp. Root444D2]KQX69248.1 hypothetical protein ASD40_01740 [Paenibacillus sp. Root444D2]
MINNLSLEKPVYIPSLEASNIYNHVERNKPIYLKYVGMIPKSLELEALVRNGLNVITNKRKKRKSNDLISVQFKTKVRDAAENNANLNQKIETTKQQIIKLEEMDLTKKKDIQRIKEKIQKKKDYITSLEKNLKEIDFDWEEVDNKSLRNLLYEEGFTLKITDYNTGEILDEIKYVVYKRSTAKSRTGKVLFIREKLSDDINFHENMINWSRMGIDFNRKEKVDYVSLLAYESLVGSCINSMVKIPTKNILVIDDVESVFDQDVNVVSVGVDGILKSKSGEAPVTQSLFDGQSLLDEQYFEGSKKSMFLLRNHFFKSAAFRCSVQKYLQDFAEKNGIDFDTWQLKDDYFGLGTVYAKDVHMITTPSSIKALKFSNMVGTKKDMWNHWCEVVDAEGSLFGIVKEEKQSKLGTDEEGRTIQQMSYQMLNSLPCDNDQLIKIASYESEFVINLKNNMDTFLGYVADTAEITNGNQMMIDLYKNNPKIAHTKMFRQWKSKTINKYVDRVKSGKVKILNADYAVLLGNPIEMLAVTVEDYRESKLALNDNQVYTKMFPFGDSLAGFRSPHTSPSNVLSVENVDNELINEYLPHLTKNIVVVNCVKHPLQAILSGSDYDSDTVLLTNSSELSDLAKKCKEEYRVCISDVGTDPSTYTVNTGNMAKIDNTLMDSQKFIGQVTNVAQLIVSNIWEAESRNKDCKNMWEKLSCLTVLSGLCIDLAKRMPEVDIKEQIIDVKKTEDMLKYKPHWWLVRNSKVAKKGNKKLKAMKENKIKSYNCPMDYLYNKFTDIKNAQRIEDLNIIDLIVKGDAGDANNPQKNKLLDILDELANNIKSTHKQEVDKDEEEMLEYERNELTSEAVDCVTKLKIKPDTMYAAIMNIIKSESDNSTIRSLNVLYQAQKTVFIRTFKKNEFFSSESLQKAL